MSSERQIIERAARDILQLLAGANDKPLSVNIMRKMLSNKGITEHYFRRALEELGGQISLIKKSFGKKAFYYFLENGRGKRYAYVCAKADISSSVISTLEERGYKKITYLHNIEAPMKPLQYYEDQKDGSIYFLEEADEKHNDE